MRKLRRIVNKLNPTDPESNFKHKKHNVMGKLDRELTKLSDQEFTRLQTILSLYSKLNSFPPSLKNFDAWLDNNRLRQLK